MIFIKHAVNVLTLLCAIYSVFINPVGGADVYIIKTVVSPSDCVGGEACTIQPKVSVLNSQTQQIVFGFQGTVYVQLGASPSEYESLYMQECDLVGCGQAVVGTLASATFIDGIASFQNLTIKTAGVGYTLKFIGRRLSGAEFAMTHSDSFEVVAGSAYKLAFQTQIGTAFGGKEFSSNPVVAVTDRGGNVVSTDGHMHVSLRQSPHSNSVLYPQNRQRVPLIDGLATFQGLYIRTAGSSYRLAFNCSLPTLGELVSEPFDVVVGSPAILSFVNNTQPSADVKQAGEFFRVTPRVQLRDAGFNLVAHDSSSALSVTLFGNPTGAVLGPTESLFPVARNGVVSLNALRMDKAGSGYTMHFELYRYSELAGNYSATGVTLLSEKFEVTLGPPRRLSIVSAAGGAWAGNQAMADQPEVQVVDFGGNVLASDFDSIVTASLLSSLAVSGSVVIDTSNSSDTTVSSVSCSLASGTYGAGQVVQLLLHLSAPVWVEVVDPLFPPYITLNAVSTSSSPPRAYLSGNTARTVTLQFTYVVAPGDSANPLSFAALSAVTLFNGTLAVNGNRHPADLTLPSLALGSAIVVDTSAPVIISADSSTADGEYGAGDAIHITLTFDQPVQVFGYPFLNFSQQLGVERYGADRGVANYSHTSDDGLRVHFVYVVGPHQNTAPGAFLELDGPRVLFGNVSHNATLVHFWNASSASGTGFYNYSYEYSSEVEGSIRHRSDTPVTLADLSLSSAVISAFAAAHQIVVDTSSPALSTSYGVQTSHDDGVFFAGEHIRLTVRFTKSVAVLGDGIFLQLDCGPHSANPAQNYRGLAFVESLGADNVTLEFLYIAERSANCSRLDLAGEDSLRIVEEGAFIRRRTALPTTDANLSTAAIYSSPSASLRSTTAISLWGFSPAVSSVEVDSTHPAGATVLHPDDEVYLRVNFTAPVYANCSPVLVISARYLREAEYVSGNLTNSFLFRYTVAVGDLSNSSVQYRNTPYALCSTTGCPYPTACKMLAHSSQPTASVSLKLFKPFTLFHSAVAVNGTTVDVRPFPLHRSTNVTSIRCLNEPGEYAPGSVLQFRVLFSDIVRIPRGKIAAYPKLFLNTLRYAEYAGGSHGVELAFTYIVGASDSVSGTFLAPLNVLSTTSALLCLGSSGCNVTNEAGQLVDLHTSSADIPVSGITLSAAPAVVLAVWSDKPTAPYSNGAYSVGEEVQIYVQVSRPVLVTGFDPRIEMDVGVEERYALFRRYLSAPTLLVFVYTAREGDMSSDLQYLSSDSLDLFGDLCVIYVAASIPTVLMDTALPAPQPLALSGQVIRIDTLDVPSVLRVASVTAQGTYAAGDVIILRADFSKEVVAEGHSYITLNCGDRVRLAKYVGYSVAGSLLTWAAPLPNSPSDATLHLFFQYEVAEGDFSSDLEYTDPSAFFAGFTDNNDVGYVLDASSYARLDAQLELPVPGETGSLSQDGTVIRVDGRAPYVISIGFASPDGVFGTNSSVVIALGFSAAVAVEGQPSVLLETGEVDGEAVYMSGSGTPELLFEYRPQPGEYSFDLDYHSDRELFLSARSSFRLNGGRVMAHSAHPILDAEVWLNPPNATLWGSTSRTSVAGEVIFDDLLVSRRGHDYQLRFSSEPSAALRTITTEQPLTVSYSSEYQLRPFEALQGKLIGYSVAIDGDIAVLGSPNSNRSVTTIQTVTSAASAGAANQMEVQIVQTTIEPQPACQQFHTSADVGQSLGGTFSVSYGSYGPSAPIPYNADPSVVKSILEFDLPVLGQVTVNREPYVFCACTDAFTWSLTFTELTMGVVGLLSFDSTKLTGSGAEVDGPIVVQSAALLAGSFRLKGLGKVSSPVPFDAGVAAMKSAVAELGLTANDVQISPSSTALTRTWSITFEAYEESYEIPLLVVDGSGLTGGKTGIWSDIVRPGINGPRGIGGYFQLEWRGNTTQRLPANASASQVKYALEALPVINFVNVNRSYLSDANGYTWTVEFVSVNRNTARGYQLQNTSNVEPLVPISNLIATNVTLVVEANWAFDDRHQLFNQTRQGTYGEQAGAVYVFQRRNESWNQVATLVGNDTSEYNRFGSSVSVSGEVMVVGAVGANMNGVPEKQSLFCSADSGYFRLAFRGWTTDPISASVSRLDLIHAIVSNTDSFSNLYSVVAIDIEDWGEEEALCANRTAVITFFSPVDGNANLLGTDTGPDLELLTLININLTRSDNQSAVLEIEETQKGTWRVHGPNSDQQQIGSAYVFRSTQSCASNASDCVKTSWEQEAQLFPIVSPVGSRFGASVAVEGNVAVVGAPGSFNEQGYVYLYEYNEVTGLWPPLQLLKDPAIANGDNFGASVAISGTTVVVGAPNYDSGTGALYVYKRTAATGPFIASQTLLSGSFALSQGVQFGFSVSISANIIVASAPQYSDSSVYLGTAPSTANREKSGAVFVFERTSGASNFLILQKLTPSNVRALDRFGFAVAAEGDTVVVSSLQEVLGALPPSKPVVEIRTHATYNKTPVRGSFKLRWMTTGMSNSQNNQSTFTTSSIPADCTAPQLKVLLQRDLPTIGGLFVSRTAKDQYDGGYLWRVTFTDQVAPVNLFEADTRLLGGTNATVSIRFVNPTPKEARGLTHVFRREAPSTQFVEQLFLSPLQHQPVDRCGHAVALSGKYALVGCPNRDQSVPGQNSGAGFVFQLGLLGLDFANDTLSVDEGESAALSLTHHAYAQQVSEDLPFTFRTVDRNGPASLQTFLRHLYGLQETEIAYPLTVVDAVGVFGMAMARSQFYGSEERRVSQWVDGMFDYRAIGDYVPVLDARVLLSEKESLWERVDTAPDSILESPAEQVSVVVTSPGVWPSPLGRLHRNIGIADVVDGTVAAEPQFSKLYESAATARSSLGSAVSVCEELGVMVSGAPKTTVSGLSNAGKVLFFKQMEAGWALQGYIEPPSSISLLTNSRFGDSVLVHRVLDRNVSLMAVGEPGANRVHVYSSEGADMGRTYTWEATLSAPEALYPQHRFGAQGSLGLFGNILVVGAAGLETAFVFIREHDPVSDSWSWHSSGAVKSLDFDQDVIAGVAVPHRQEFGRAVAVSGRSLVVGAPFADYDKVGSALEERDWLTEGTDIVGYGRGKAFVFFSAPAAQLVRIVAPEQLLEGEFRLNYLHEGMNATTAVLNFDSREAALEDALNALPNLDSVTVSASSSFSPSTGYRYEWTVTFNAEWTEPGRLVALWRSNGCENCTAFSFSGSDPHNQMTTEVLSSVGPLVQQQDLVASDRRNGNRFGWSVAVDGSQIAVGAPFSSTPTTTTWDFEAGSLLGWSKSGSAFDFQPTFADNTYMRAVSDVTIAGGVSLRARGQSTGVRGLYFIGTAEKRPGNPSDYSSADPTFPQGSQQGDGPTGTLTSDVFLIPANGSTIRFLIGGGCDVRLEYVELLVDGLSVARRTGKCSEKMSPAFFDVVLVTGRAAQIRIVDMSSANWGHINVDSFEFDWVVGGATIDGRNNKISTGGVTETPRSGAAYLFRRHAATSEDLQCPGSTASCVWTQEAVFTASDKRPNTFFGTAVAVNDNLGILAVGAPNAQFSGFYKEAPSVYPHQNLSGESDAAGLRFPVRSNTMPLFQSEGVNMPERSGAYGVWALEKQAQVQPSSLAYEESGAVYVYSKRHAKVSNTGVITQPQKWFSGERAKIQPPDAFARDHFGASLDLSDTTLVTGAPGQDGSGMVDAGAVYLYRTVFAALTFSEIEYAVSEGRTKFATVTLLRDPDVFSGRVVIEFATSDLTARGVDSLKFAACMRLSVRERGPAGCGDYEQSTGVVVIEPGDMSGGFVVNLVDDLCYERFVKYIQVTVSVPGSASLQSEALSAKIRVDDNDFGFGDDWC